jgi:hypothetical protein
MFFPLSHFRSRHGWGSAHPAACTAGELPRVRRAPDDGRDLVEGHPEHVVQHEGQTFDGIEPVEDDE